MSDIPCRLGLQQRVFPSYRASFFELLAQSIAGGFSLFAGEPRPEEAVQTTTHLTHGSFIQARNIHIGRGVAYFCYQSNLLDWLKSWQPDILILEANPRYLQTPAAVRWMRTRRRPVIGWGLGAPPQAGWLAELRQKNRRRFIHQFDALITYSHRGADQYASLGFDHHRIFVARNAVVPKPTHPLPLRAPLSGRKPILLFVGRLQERKRLDLLLQACAALPAQLQPELWIVGDGPERQPLQALSQHLFPAQFFGSKQGTELDNLFKAADLFVLPGTGGLAVQQAMSWGLPVIVAEGDGTQDDLVRCENGWQIPPGNLPALINTLTAALNQPERLSQMGATSYEIVKNEINLEAMVAAFHQAIRSVLDR